MKDRFAGLVRLLDGINTAAAWLARWSVLLMLAIGFLLRDRLHSFLYSRTGIDGVKRAPELTLTLPALRSPHSAASPSSGPDVLASQLADELAKALGRRRSWMGGEAPAGACSGAGALQRTWAWRDSRWARACYGVWSTPPG